MVPSVLYGCYFKIGVWASECQNRKFALCLWESHMIKILCTACIERNQNSTLGSCKLPTSHLPFVGYFECSGESRTKTFIVLLLYSDSTIFEVVVCQENYLKES